MRDPCVLLELSTTTKYFVATFFPRRGWRGEGEGGGGGVRGSFPLETVPYPRESPSEKQA